MPNLNDVCKDIVESVEYALACAVVDQNSGLLLGVSHNVSYFTQTLLDTIAASSVELFRGRSVSIVESMIAEIKNEEPVHKIEEMQFSTKDNYHFLTIVPEKQHLLAILVARKSINLGMGWACLKSRLREIAKVCP